MAEKYLDLSGLQAFYDKLKTTAFVDSALSDTSTKPVQNKVIAVNLAAHESAINTLSAASSTWNAKQDAITDLDGIRNSAKSGWSALSSISANSSTWATNTNKIADMTDVATYFDSTSAIYAKSATSATNAANAANATKAGSATKLTAARNIAASGNVTWSVSFDGSKGVTGNATINSVPSNAISAVPWEAISGLTGSGDQTNKIITPSAVDAKIANAMSTKASFKGPYATRGEIPASALDKLSIFLVGPTGVAPDQYEEWVLTGTTTAQMLQIGDTSTDLSDYLKTTAFTAWSGVTSTLYSGTSRSAKTAGNASALGGVTATTVTSNAAKGAAASAWIDAHSGDYASAVHDHAYTLSGNGTAVNVSAGVNFKPSGNNVKFFVSGNDIYISAKNDNSTAYIPSGFKVSAIYGTTTGQYFLSALKLNAGSNITFTSASNSQLTINATQPSVGNGTISITTGATPATGQFTVNQTGNTTITLGSMALKASGSYMATGSMVPYTSAEVVTGITW